MSKPRISYVDPATVKDQAMIAEFESDLIRMRTREGMKVARAKGRLRGKQPKLKPAQEAHLVELWRAGQHTSAELAELVLRRSLNRLPGRQPRWRTSTSAAPLMSN